MSSETKRFIVKVLAAAVMMVVVAWIIFTFFIPGRYLPILPWMLGFFTVVTISIYNYQVKVSKKDLGRFTRSSMITSIGRLMLYSLFAIIYMAFNQENALVFVGSLIFVYSVFTVLEVSDLTGQIRQNKNSK